MEGNRNSDQKTRFPSCLQVTIAFIEEIKKLETCLIFGSKEISEPQKEVKQLVH